MRKQSATKEHTQKQKQEKSENITKIKASWQIQWQLLPTANTYNTSLSVACHTTTHNNSKPAM